MTSHSNFRRAWLPLGAALFLVISAFALFSNVAAAADVNVTLSGDQEVPAVTSTGAGTGVISIGTDRTVSGSVTTTGISGTAAHIHQAAPGKNGPVVIPLTKDKDTYTVPAGSTLTVEQY